MDSPQQGRQIRPVRRSRGNSLPEAPRSEYGFDSQTRRRSRAGSSSSTTTSSTYSSTFASSLTNPANATESEDDVAVVVAIRLRPVLRQLRESETQVCAHVETDQSIRVQAFPSQRDPFPRPRVFEADLVLNQDATQQDVFDATAAKMIPKVLDGYNACCCCYGQTGSGKTYTMVGDDLNPGKLSFLPWPDAEV
jgi:hypothetical protein